MTPAPSAQLFRGHRFPREVIAQAVWLCYRFPLRLRMVEEMLAVDQDGFTLDALVQSRRDRKAARRLMRKLLNKAAHAPRVMITDKPPSYAAANEGMRLTIEHRQHKGHNNRAENSH